MTNIWYISVVTILLELSFLLETILVHNIIIVINFLYILATSSNSLWSGLNLYKISFANLIKFASQL